MTNKEFQAYLAAQKFATSTGVCHAANRRGIKNCGDTTSGDLRTNVEKYPENWSQVTCSDCLKTKES